jgi:hypothetical protein
MALPLPPVRERLIDDRGFISPRWQRWLVEFITALEAAL